MNPTLRYDPRQISRQTKPSDTPSSSPSRSHRRQPLLQRSLSSPSPTATCDGSTPAEFCGGTTASCAAVWCCCPCGLVNLLVLAVYKVPGGICRHAIRSHRRKRLVKNGMLPPLPTDGKSINKHRGKTGTSIIARSDYLRCRYTFECAKFQCPPSDKVPNCVGGVCHCPLEKHVTRPKDTTNSNCGVASCIDYCASKGEQAYACLLDHCYCRKPPM